MTTINHNPVETGSPASGKPLKRSRPLHIAKSAINALPLRAYDGPVTLIADPESAAAAAKNCLTQEILGFDTETRAAFSKGESYPPALVQLAASDRVYLFRVQVPGVLSACLPVLESPTVLKAGVAIGDDLKALRAIQPFEPAGFVELQIMSDQRGLQNNGLRGLAALLLGFRISKGAQTSNWNLPRLSERQLRYAATDAWVSREIYRALAVRSGSPERT